MGMAEGLSPIDSKADPNEVITTKAGSIYLSLRYTFIIYQKEYCKPSFLPLRYVSCKPIDLDYYDEGGWNLLYGGRVCPTASENTIRTMCAVFHARADFVGGRYHT